MIPVLYGDDGKFHTYRAKGVIAYSLEDLAQKLGVPMSEFDIQIDMAAHLRAKPKPKAKLAGEDFGYF